jgi:hypothetical protein
VSCGRPFLRELRKKLMRPPRLSFVRHTFLFSLSGTPIHGVWKDSDKREESVSAPIERQPAAKPRCKVGER